MSLLVKQGQLFLKTYTQFSLSEKAYLCECIGILAYLNERHTKFKIPRAALEIFILISRWYNKKVDTYYT